MIQNHTRKLALAIAIAALAGCDSSGELSVQGIKITPDNAPAVAADGVDLMEGAADLGGDVDPTSLPTTTVAVTGTGPASELRRGATMSSITQQILQNVNGLSGRAMAGPQQYNCSNYQADPETGYYITDYTSGWSIEYVNCEISSSDPYGGWSNYTLVNGSASGSSSGYSNWDADYENLAWRWSSTSPYGGYSGSYNLNGHFEGSYAYGGPGASTAYPAWFYSATGFRSEYSYEATGVYAEEGMASGAGIVEYDNYSFESWEDAYGGWWWEGNVSARDSRRGQWYVYTASPWGMDYCDQTVDGEIVFSGNMYDDDHGGASSGFNQPGNVLHMIGDGSSIVTLELYNAGGSLINSQTQDWFPYDYTCG